MRRKNLWYLIFFAHTPPPLPRRKIGSGHKVIYLFYASTRLISYCKEEQCVRFFYFFQVWSELLLVTDENQGFTAYREFLIEELSIRARQVSKKLKCCWKVTFYVGFNAFRRTRPAFYVVVL